MKIHSATFTKGIVNPEDLLIETLPQVVCIGRSNVGKSSLINALTQQKNLAKASSLPGRTRQINLFLINHRFLLVDLPGYGFAKASSKDRDNIYELINGYLFGAQQKHHTIILIIDAFVGPTKDDLEMLSLLKEDKKNIIIVLNKIDKVKKSHREKHIQDIKKSIGPETFVEVSTKAKTGLGELLHLLRFEK
jgi:GTP-binding protein